MKVVALAGGTGSSKLLKGLSSLDQSLTVVANVGDNIWMHGVYVCPDIDVATYSLAGIVDQRKGWGIREDTFETLGQIELYGEEAWFAIGDRDMATSLLRTKWLSEGQTLTQVTNRISKALGVKTAILPATDFPVETMITTGNGEMNLQEFWVKNGGKPEANGVRYRGASAAQPTRDVREALSQADRIILCPANPVTSIGPILAIKGFRRALANSRARVWALSPMIGVVPFSGPAGKLMKAIGTSPDSVGVAGLYRDFLDGIIISRQDKEMTAAIGRLGVRCALSETRIKNLASARRLAKELLEA